jgi:hypothetical protein
MSGQRRQSGYLGLGPQSLQGPNTGSGSSVAYPLEFYQTPLLDLTKTYSNIEIIPARPGYVALIFFTRWMIESKNGTQVTPITCQAGSNITKNNNLALNSNPSNINVNNASTVPPCFVLGQSQLVPAPVLINTPILFDVVTPASGTGGFSLMARLFVSAIWAAVGS